MTDAVQVLDSICQFMHSHYIVRNAIVKCLEKGYRECPTKSIALNLALCSAIGFGIGRDNEKCKSILMDNAISDEDFEHNLRILEQISELEYNYQKGNFRVAHRQGYILNFDVVEPQLFRQQFGKAERQYRREVGDLTSAVGFDHYLTSIAKRELASILNYAGRYEDAAKLRLELVGSAKKMFGDDNLASQMVLLGDLARTYRDQGLLKEAEALQLQAVKAVSQLQGSDHRHTLLIMADLATTYRAQSRTDKAEALQREIVEKSLRALGRDHVETLSSIANLSSTLRIQAMSLPTDSPIRPLRLDEAEELQLQVLETSLRVVGDRNPTTIVHMSNLAATYDAKHQWQKAEPVWVQVLDEIVKTRGADHPEVLPIKEHLAINLAKQNRLHEAELLQRQVLDLASELLEPTDVSLQQYRIALAMTLAHQGRWSEAEILRSQIVRTRKETRGDELPWLLDNMTALAALFWTHGRDSEAQELQVCTAEVIRRIYGPEGTATINAEKLLSVFSGQAS
jgi:tetratricopeptide (TPR) repeat protein